MSYRFLGTVDPWTLFFRSLSSDIALTTGPWVGTLVASGLGPLRFTMS